MRFSLVSLVLLVPAVAAHGFLGKITIDGKSYAGDQPGTGKGADSIIRRIDTTSPLKGADNANLPCGSNSQPAALMADAQPGSNINVFWTDIGSNWPHNTGPVMTYMAECTGTPDCTTFNASNARWFKIDQLGLKDAQSGTWWQADFMQAKSLNMSIPSDLKAGNYLLRSEIVALHLATEQGGAEFYPACAQLKVGGNGTTTPNATVSFPGAYSDNDAGIFDPTVFNTPVQYTFPGGPVSNLVSPADSGSLKDLEAATTKAASGEQTSSSSTASASATGPGGSNSTSTNASAASQPSASAPASSKSCKSKRRVHARSWRLD